MQVTRIFLKESSPSFMAKISTLFEFNVSIRPQKQWFAFNHFFLIETTTLGSGSKSHFRQCLMTTILVLNISSFLIKYLHYLSRVYPTIPCFHQCFMTTILVFNIFSILIKYLHYLPWVYATISLPNLSNTII